MAVSLNDTTALKGAGMANDPKVTLDEDTTKPSTTAPGAGPADTTDPTERATSAPFDPSTPEAQAAGTVNAVKPVPKPKAVKRDTKADRFETFEATNAMGETVTVKRNIDTGEQTVS